MKSFITLNLKTEFFKTLIEELFFIEYGFDFQTFYAHLRSTALDPDDLVKQGDPIGTLGATVGITGAHLHWSIGLDWKLG